MRSGRIRLGAGAVVLVGTAALGLVGCGDDDASGPDDPGPAGTTGSSTPADEEPAADEVGPPCDVVSAADLATWTGVPRRVAGPEETAGVVECRTVGDPDDGHLVSWTFQPSSGDHEQDVAGTLTSAAERQDVEIPDGGPGVVLTDESLRLVTVLTWSEGDEQLLSVRVLDSGIGTEDLTTDHLTEVATRIAGAYASFAPVSGG